MRGQGVDGFLLAFSVQKWYFICIFGLKITHCNVKNRLATLGLVFLEQIV